MVTSGGRRELGAGFVAGGWIGLSNFIGTRRADLGCQRICRVGRRIRGAGAGDGRGVLGLRLSAGQDGAKGQVGRERGGGVALQGREWNLVEVVENSEACEEHREIVVKVGVSGSTGTVCDAYRYPGQYVKLKDQENEQSGELFLAMACAPNLQGYFEFLVKASESSQWLCQVPQGSFVQMSPVMGKGFPLVPSASEGVTDVLLFATGSGVAPIRASIESLLNGLNVPSRRKVKLYYGARYPSRMAFKDRLGLWEEDGVQIVQVMSRPGEDHIDWSGRTGYIQQALEEDGIERPDQVVALLCGVKGMTQEVKKLLLNAGVPENRILFNF